MSKWPKQNETDKFYGNPRGKNGGPSPAWERTNLTLVKAPWPIVTSWDSSPVKGIRVHVKCAESLIKIFNSIWEAAGQDVEVVRQWGMHLYGGGYNFRIMRGGSRLSMHSWGCAVDFDPAQNEYGDASPNFANCPAVLNAFADEGWTWGGSWAKPDGMHWQAADVV
jgi:hypothetical protein